MNISQNTTEILKPVMKYRKLFLWGCQPDGTPTLSICIQHGTGAQQTGHTYWKKYYSGPLIFTFTKTKSRYIINLNVEGKIIKVLEDNAKW